MRSGAKLQTITFLVLITGCLGFACRRDREPPQPPLHSLALASPKSGRATEARFSGGFGWAPLRRAGDEQSTEDAEFAATAAALVIRSRQDSTPAVQHAAAVGNVFLGQADDAVSRLEELARGPAANGDVWNDLAAARYTAGVKRGEIHRLPRALAEIDGALQMMPRSAVASFNRALILERLGFGWVARDAWRECASLEPDEGWKREAQARIGTQQSEDPLRPRLEEALRGKRSLRDVMARDREGTRLLAEGVMLVEWAENVIAGKTADAEKRLADVRTIAALLAEGGDALLQHVVSEIDAAPAQMQLARALTAYRDARKGYARQQARSDRALIDTADLLQRAGLAHAAYLARYYAINAMIDGNDFERAHDEIANVMRSIDRLRHPTLFAGLEKQLGRFYSYRGLWSAALLHLHRAQVLYARQSEPSNAAFTEGIIAEAENRLGRFGQGWAHLQSALRGLDQHAPPQRFAEMMTAPAHVEILRGDYEAALAMLRVGLAVAARSGTPTVVAEMELRRAWALLGLGRIDDASTALSLSRRAAEAIPDENVRRRLVANVDVIRGEIVRRRDPARAVRLISESIGFYERSGLRMLMPAALLSRGRSSLAAGDARAALADFMAGVREVEQQREGLAASYRETMFDAAPALSSEALALLIAEGRNSDAYALVERARARSLAEALWIDPAHPSEADVRQIAKHLPANAMVLEYGLLPDGFVVFSFSGTKPLTVAVRTTPVSTLRVKVQRLNDALRRKAQTSLVQTLAADLHDELISPVIDRIRGSELVIVVPDRFLSAVPFAVLYDRGRGRYLVDDHGLVVAPSGRFLGRRRPAESRASALIVGAPDRQAQGPLPAARFEAQSIVDLYPGSTPLFGSDATVERFVAAAPAATLIHYAGHADTDDYDRGFLLFAPSPSQFDGRLDAAAISRLQLPRTSLVILAACSTVRGDIGRVDGMPSLARAFLLAGVPSVVGTMWDIDDESSAQLFRLFHERLHGGASPSVALVAAQRALRSSPDPQLSHPAAWAGIVLLGMD